MSLDTSIVESHFFSEECNINIEHIHNKSAWGDYNYYEDAPRKDWNYISRVLDIAFGIHSDRESFHVKKNLGFPPRILLGLISGYRAVFRGPSINKSCPSGPPEQLLFMERPLKTHPREDMSDGSLLQKLVFLPF